MLRKHVNTSLVSVLKLFIVAGCYVGFKLICASFFFLAVNQICPAEGEMCQLPNRGICAERRGWHQDGDGDDKSCWTFKFSVRGHLLFAEVC